MGRILTLLSITVILFSSCAKNATGEFKCTCTSGPDVLEEKLIKNSNFSEANWECKNLRVKYANYAGATCGIY